MNEAETLKTIKQVSHDVLARLTVTTEQRDEIQSICTVEVLTQMKNCQISGQKPSKSYLCLKAYQRAREYLDAEKAARHEPLTEGVAEAHQTFGEGCTASELATALKRLPAISQRLLRMRYWEGQSERQIAERLGLSKGDTHNRIAEATKELRTTLNGGQGERAARGNGRGLLPDLL